MAQEFVVKNGLINQGDMVVTGSEFLIGNSTASNYSASGRIQATSFTGSFSGIALLGTSSNAVTSSYSLTSSLLLGSVTSASYALSGSFTLTSITSSYLTGGTANITQLTASQGILSKGILINGSGNTAGASFSHAEGLNTTVGGNATYSHTEGNGTIANGIYSHAEGYFSVSQTDASHSEGNGTTAAGTSSHAEGINTISNGDNSHAEGNFCQTFGLASHAEGNTTTASVDHSHAEGYATNASGSWSHAEGSGSITTNNAAHAEGQNCIAAGIGSHAEGYYSKAAHNRTFIWASNYTQSYISTTKVDQFMIAAGSGSYFSCSVGVNTDSPSASLQVNGTISASSWIGSTSFTGSFMTCSNNIIALSFTGSLLGTASYAKSSSYMSDYLQTVIAVRVFF